MMEKEFGYEVTYIPFPGGGTVAKNLIGKQIDSTVNNPAEQGEFFRAGKSRPIVQFTGERMAAYKDVPTAKELASYRDHLREYFDSDDFQYKPRDERKTKQKASVAK